MNSNSASQRILIDICHPAGVHVYKYIYRELTRLGYEIRFVAKIKDVTEDLLKAYNLPYTVLSYTKKGVLRKLGSLLPEMIRYWRILRKFKPTLILGSLPLHSSIVALVTRTPYIAIIDTEYRRLMDLVTFPAAKTIVTPAAYQRQLGKKQVTYPGNHEFAYLHPVLFQPRSDIRAKLGLATDRKYVVIRKVAWQAYHDIGQNGIETGMLLRLIKTLEADRNVFITAESALPPELEQYRLKLPPELLHDVLWGADLVVTEGSTTVSEAVCLGTPAVYINELLPGIIQQYVEQGLLIHFDRLTIEDFPTIAEFVEDEGFKKKHQLFLDRIIHVNQFLTWLIKGFPDSIQSVKDKPNLINQFK